MLNNDPRRFLMCLRGLRFSRTTVIAVLGLLVAVLVAGCQTDSSSNWTVDNPYTHFDFLYPAQTNVLAQADQISITFRYSTNFNTVQRIGLDGMVNLQGVGEVKAEGKTIRQLQDELTALYKAEVKDDPITVRIAFPAASIYVTGAVTHPGKILMDRRMTVVDAIAEAGGADPYRASLSKVSVLRVKGDTQRVFRVDLNRMLNGEDRNPFFLEPFDIVRVPTKTFNF